MWEFAVSQEDVITDQAMKWTDVNQQEFIYCEAWLREYTLPSIVRRIFRYLWWGEEVRENSIAMTSLSFTVLLPSPSYKDYEGSSVLCRGRKNWEGYPASFFSEGFCWSSWNVMLGKEFLLMFVGALPGWRALDWVLWLWLQWELWVVSISGLFPAMSVLDRCRFLLVPRGSLLPCKKSSCWRRRFVLGVVLAGFQGSDWKPYPEWSSDLAALLSCCLLVKSSTQSSGHPMTIAAVLPCPILDGKAYENAANFMSFWTPPRDSQKNRI